MIKKLLIPLNLQTFAEEVTPATTPSEPTESNSGGASAPTAGTGVDYSKIEEILNKRTSTTEDSVLKGYLKQQGLTGDELTQAVNTYKTQKQQAELAKQQEAQLIKAENEKLKAQILNTKIDNSLTTLAIKEGVNAEKLPFLSKLISRDGLIDDKGAISEEKLKTAIDEVIKIFPEFKGSSNQSATGFTKIGGDTGGTGTTTEVDEKLDAIFGIKKK